MTFVVSAIDSIGTAFSGIAISLLTANVATIVAIVVVIAWALPLPLHYVFKKLERQDFYWYLLDSLIPCVIFIYVFNPFGQD